jgi:hypothetical protein
VLHTLQAVLWQPVGRASTEFVEHADQTFVPVAKNRVPQRRSIVTVKHGIWQLNPYWLKRGLTRALSLNWAEKVNDRYLQKFSIAAQALFVLWLHPSIHQNQAAETKTPRLLSKPAEACCSLVATITVLLHFWNTIGELLKEAASRYKLTQRGTDRNDDVNNSELLVRVRPEANTGESTQQMHEFGCSEWQDSTLRGLKHEDNASIYQGVNGDSASSKGREHQGHNVT